MCFRTSSLDGQWFRQTVNQLAPFFFQLAPFWRLLGLTSVLPPTFFITSCERLTVRLSRSVAGRAHAATRQCRTRRTGGSLCCTNSRAGGSLFTVKFVLLGLGLLPPVNLEQRVVACQTQSLSKETGSGGGGGEGEEFIQNCIREARFVARWDQHAVSNRQP